MADTTKKATDTRRPSESSEKTSKKKTLAKVTKLFWVALGILIFLLILSIVILSAKMYKYVKLVDEGRIVEISVNNDEELQLFSAEYKNDLKETIIKSATGDPVVAPGAKDTYTVRLQNKENVALDYIMKPKVTCGGVDSIPIEFRLFAPDGSCLTGGYSDEGWVTAEELNDITIEAVTLSRGSADNYEFEWKWPFERGDDAGDTILGNGIDGKSPWIDVKMEISASVNNSKDANGGFFGFGEYNTFWWWIFFILLLIAIILLILSLIHKKDKEPEPVVVYAPAPTPAPAPEPVPVPVVTPVVTPKKKDKGFVGKMAYVNIDTLVDVFNNGDTITLKILKEKGLVDEKATQVKILARNDMVLNKAFHIETQGISSQARQKVIAAGGTIKIIDG